MKCEVFRASDDGEMLIRDGHGGEVRVSTEDGRELASRLLGYGFLTRSYQRWTPERIAILVDDRAAGVPASITAKKLGVTRAALLSTAARLKV